MAKTGTKDEEQSSGLGIVLAFAIGIAALIGLYAFSKMLKPVDQEAAELPLASILIEVSSFDANTRRNIAALERDLRATGVFQSPYGPAEAKILLPGAKPGDEPIAKDFDALTDAEWEVAWKYLQMTEYLIPRIYRFDGNACVIRLDPKGGRDFAPDAGAKLLQVCEAYREKFKLLRVYCRALGIGNAQDRDALNASFGVQLTWLMIHEPASESGMAPWATAAGVKKLAEAKKVLKTNPHYRRVTSDANWVIYYWTVRIHSDKEVALPGRDPEVQEAFNFAKANRIGTLLSQDGKVAIVDTSTDVEGQQNAELIYDMAANLQVELKVEARHPYQPVIRYKSKTEAPR
jgi:hypothetical protein